MKRFLFGATALLFSGLAQSATYIVRSDADLVRTADAIVVATTLRSYSQPARNGGIETISEFSVEETIKGPVRHGRTVRVTVLGGVLDDLALVIPGSPHFAPGDRVLLFLSNTGPGEWRTVDLAIGVFRFATDSKGQSVLVRDAEIVGWDTRGEVHREPRRAADRFLDFVREIVRSGRAEPNYYVPEAPLPTEPEKTPLVIEPTGNAGGYPASAYVMTSTPAPDNVTRPVRWPVVDGVKPFHNSNTQPGRGDGGINGIVAGLGAWTNEMMSNANYRYGGPTGTPQRFGTNDNINGIAFEDPAGEVSGSAGPSGGTLGTGGFWVTTNNPNTLGSETFWSIIEGNVILNDGLSTWNGLNTPRFDQLLAHELGHSLGFRHSDQTATHGPCTTPPLPCTSQAIMNSSIIATLGANPQQWDIDAVSTVYPSADNFSFFSNFDGDAASDRAVFRSNEGKWWILQSSGGAVVRDWGQAGDVPVAADYDGDGRTDVAIWRPATRVWWILYSGGGATQVGWGDPGDLLVPGDYDGDGKADIAIWRPSTGVWWIRKSTGGILTLNWGQTGDVPVPADYDGDGETDAAVWRYSTGAWWILTSGSNFTAPSMRSWGQSGDIPVPGKYDADTLADVAVWRPGGNQWWIAGSVAGIPQVVNWGAEGDLPVVGDYNGDGRSDYAIWRPSTGVWWTQFSNLPTVITHVWGVSGDTPVHQVNDRH